MINVKMHDKVRQIYEALPKMNCGACGFDGCSKYAAAVAEGKASPFVCCRDPEIGYTLSRILKESTHTGINSDSELAVSSSQNDLKEEIHELSNKVDNILSLIERLANKQNTIRG